MTLVAWRKLAARCLVASALSAGSAAAWSQAAAAPIPQPWISYAQLVGGQFQAWLESDDEGANQLHHYLEDRILHPHGDTPPAAIVIRAWIDAGGTVSRVEFASLGDPQADATLRRLLLQHAISEAPPPDMQQPLRVRLHLEANPDADAEDANPGANADAAAPGDPASIRP